MYKIDEVDIQLAEKINKEYNSTRDRFNESIIQQEKMLEIMMKAINHAEYNNLNESSQFWNLAGFVTIISSDLKTIGMHLTLSTNEWTKRFFVRQACLLIYESINDLFDLLGRQLRESIANYLQNPELEQKYNQLRKELNEFKRAYHQKLKQIRNVATAHRDQNIKEQLATIVNLSWNENMQIVTAFDKIINKLGAIIQETINLDLDRLGGEGN